MAGIWRLALRYTFYYRLRSGLLIAALTLVISLPLITGWTVERFTAKALQRADTTPLVIGAKGSRMELAMHALYFRGQSLPAIQYDQLGRVDSSGLARTIPLLIRFRAQGYAIVGTTDEYLKHRALTLASGTPMTRLGDCLLGAAVARALNLASGDRLLSDPENMFDLAGPVPLNMRVAGVLQNTGTPDDDVVFCDLRTAWILAGIGHGHDMQKYEAPGTGPDPAAHEHAASRENLQQYEQVTDENVGRYHFHGRRELYPLTAIIALPHSEKSTTLLLGRYLSTDEPCQVIEPIRVMEELLEIVGRVRRVLDTIAVLLTSITCVLIALVTGLSIRLRSGEMRTLMLIGCSRLTITCIVLSELAIVLAASGLLAVAVSGLASTVLQQLILP